MISLKLLLTASRLLLLHQEIGCWRGNGVCFVMDCVAGLLDFKCPSLSLCLSPSVGKRGLVQPHLLCRGRGNGGHHWEIHQQRLLPESARPFGPRPCPRRQGLWDLREANIKALKRQLQRPDKRRTRSNYTSLDFLNCHLWHNSHQVVCRPFQYGTQGQLRWRVDIARPCKMEKSF